MGSISSLLCMYHRSMLVPAAVSTIRPYHGMALGGMHVPAS
jgi:hypothetical protein